MNKIKKLVLSLSVAITMAIAFVVGLVGLNQDKPLKNNTSPQNVNAINQDVQTSQNLARPVKKTLTFKEGDLEIRAGGNNIDFSYSPDNIQGATSVAYQYVFNNPMTDPMAVNLKSIDTTGVTLSYAYFDSAQTTISSSSTVFEPQSVATNKTKYIYIVVTPTSTVPTTFQSNVVWYQGRAGELEIYNKDGSLYTTYTIVKGQPTINEPIIDAPTGTTHTEWYLDQACTNFATFPLTEVQPLYVRFPNLPTSYLAWDSTTSSYYVKKDTATLPENLIIPANYNDGTNDLARVTYIYDATSSSKGVFYNKTSLQSVDLPSTITSISSYAFYYCSGLTSITLPSNLTSIGNYAFSECEGLTSIIIPAGVTSIGTNAFYSCSGLSGVYMSDIASWCKISFGSIDGNPLYYANNLYLNNQLVTNLVIPEGVTTISKYAFYRCSGLTSVTLPSSLTSIGSVAFGQCYTLAEVYNLSSLNITAGSSSNGEVGYYAVAIYTDINIESRIQTINNVHYYVYGTSFIAVGPISRDVTSVTIDTRITSIKKAAFQGCDKLASVDLSGCTSLTSIGSNAFEGCSGLTSITLPSSLTSIGNYAFQNCSGLTSITLPSSLTSIGGQAFNSCSGLTSITLPSSLTSISGSAFLDCSGLESIVVEAGNTKYDSRNNCNAIIETATNTLVVGCKNTIIPNDITSIGSQAFSGCSGLTGITLPSSLTSIGGSAFNGCSGLSGITLPSSLTSIGDYAFRDCSGLTSIVIPASVTKIGRFAFQLCSNLSSITFEDTTSTWYYTSSYNYIDGTEIDVTDASANATYFTSTYYDKYWYKV